MDIEKFRSLSLEREALEDREWLDWVVKIGYHLSILKGEREQSSGDEQIDLKSTAMLCMENPEGAIHVLVDHMLDEGVFWAHIELLRRVSDASDAGLPSMDELGKRYLPRITRILSWYQRLADGPVIENRLKNYRVNGADHGGLEVEFSGDGSIRVFVEGYRDKKASVSLCREDASKLTDMLRVMTDTRYKNRGSAFLGVDKTSGGLSLSSSNMGEPFRETCIISVVEDSTTVSSSEVEIGDIRYMAEAMTRILQPGATPSGPRMR